MPSVTRRKFEAHRGCGLGSDGERAERSNTADQTLPDLRKAHRLNCGSLGHTQGNQQDAMARIRAQIHVSDCLCFRQCQ